MPQPNDSIPLTFRLIRKADVSGTSGTGHVADGVQFPDGTCVLRWRTAKSSTAVYASHADLMAIHGHDGATVCEWAADAPRRGASGEHDIAARLNGPSPADVAALLRDIGHGYCGSCDRRMCPSCSADLDVVTSTRPDGKCFPDCKLDAMIKQCEGA